MVRFDQRFRDGRSRIPGQQGFGTLRMSTQAKVSNYVSGFESETLKSYDFISVMAAINFYTMAIVGAMADAAIKCQKNRWGMGISFQTILSFRYNFYLTTWSTL